MCLSDSEDYLATASKRNDHQSLTKESLYLLNLEHQRSENASSSPSTSKYSRYYLSADNETVTTPTITGSSTPENAPSSSSSSLASFDESSEDRKQLAKFYGNYNKSNTSNSSIATVVQQLASSTSTLNLQPKALQHPSIFDSSQSTPTEIPSTPPNELETSHKVPRKIKSSLKLPGLTRSRSMPSTSATPKTVRFSSTLTRVKTFNEHAKPSSISLENSPESSSPYDEPDFSGSPKAFFDLRNSFNSSSDEDESEEDYFTYKPKLQLSKWILRCSNFDLLALHQTANSAPVKLISLSIMDNSNLVGFVEVINIAFEKYVEIKFTTDDWKSTYLVTGSYDSSIDSTRDRFRFEINLNRSLLLGGGSVSNSQTREQSVNVGLCVKYVAGGSATYYDNNNSQNYQFQLVNQPKQKLRKSKSYYSRSSQSQQRAISSLPSFTKVSNVHDGNFASADAHITSPQPDNYTTTTRYFPEDTDYFNPPSIYNPIFKAWNIHSSTPSTTSHPDPHPFQQTSSKSIASPKSTGSTASSSAFASSTNTPTLSTKSSFPSTTLPAQNHIKSDIPTVKNQSYHEFLNKYCFFKSGDPNGDFNESVTIR